MIKVGSDLFGAASDVLVGGVNSPARAFKAIGIPPVFIDRGEGPYIYDTENRRYIDYIQSWGPMILGHCHPQVSEALHRAVDKGTSFGAPTVAETEMAKRVQGFFPSMEKMRFVSSGTEATMSAIRLARGATGRRKILKFEGCYHGHADSLLVAAGSGALTLGEPDSKGVLADLAQHTLTAPFNDLDTVKAIFERWGDDLAGVIVEPVVGNMGVVLPQPGFLAGLRQSCDDYGALLILDEVMTGFRVGLNGAQALYDCKPDLTVLGKVVGGGLPCGVYGGRADIMAHVAPEGGVYQAGTLSGNPLAMAAGIITLDILKTADAFAMAEKQCQQLVVGIKEIITSHSVPATIQSVGTMWTLFWCPDPIHNLTDAKRSDLAQFRTFYKAMLRQGIYMAPSQFEANFVSAVHTEENIDSTLTAIRTYCQTVR